MTKPFTKTFRVRLSEINAIGQVDLASYFRYVIETAWDRAATIGLSLAESDELGFAWVIREVEINLYRPLYAYENFDLTIWLIKWRRVRGTRGFELRIQGDGDLVADGVQQLVALDSKTLRPAAPPKHIMDRFLTENLRVLQQRPFLKFQIQHEAAYVKQRDVEWRDLDSLEHVNNATFAAFAEDAITQAFADVGWPPAHFKTQNLAVVNKRAHIQYQAPALWGDTLDVFTYLVELELTRCMWYIEIIRASDEERIIQCVIELSLADRISREEQPLPESLYIALQKRFAAT